MKRTAVPAAIMCLAVAAALPASAHHAVNAQFDVTRTVDMEGTLVKFLDTNPHAYWYFDVIGPDKKVVQWNLESVAPNAWRRAGLRLKDDIKPGTVYKFKIAPGLIAGDPIGLIKGVEVDGKWISVMK